LTSAVVLQLPLIAEVECRSEGAAEEHPVALRIGGERFDIHKILENAVVGGPDAGDPIERRLTVRTEDLRTFRLDRVLPDGEWRVALMTGSPRDPD